MAGRQALSMLNVAVLARLLPVQAYGQIGMAGLFVNFLMLFRDLGTASAVVQKEEVSEELLSSVFWVNMALGCILCLLTFPISYGAAWFFHEPPLAAIVRALGVAFVFSSAGIVQTALLRRQMSFRTLTTAELAGAFAAVTVSIGCAVSGMGVWSLVFGTLTSTLITTLCLWCLCTWRPRFVFAWCEVRPIVSYSLNLSGSTFINYFARNADYLVVGRFLGKTPLGFYQMAYTLMLYPIQNVSQVVAQVLFPAFSRMQHDDERFRAAFLRTCMAIALVTFPLMAGMFVTSDQLVRVFLGEQWAPVSWLLRVLAAVGLVQSVVTMVGQIYTAKGRTDLMFWWTGVATLVIVIAFFIGVNWGIRGVAVSYAIVTAILLYPGCAIPFRLIGLRPLDFARALWPQLLVSLLMAAICGAWIAFWSGRGLAVPYLFASTVALGILVYVVLLRVFRPPVIREVRAALEETPNPVLARVAALLIYLDPVRK